MAVQIQKPELATFIHLQKNAGSSISKWLEKNLDGQRFWGKHGGIGAIAKKAGGIENLGYTFAVVRNPFARAVSTYHYQVRKVEERQVKVDKGATRYTQQDLDETRQLVGVGFSQWLLNLPQHYLFRSQLDLTDGVDYVMKMENLLEEFEVIQKRFNCYVPLDHRNKSNHKHYREYYNEKAKKRILDSCSKDLETFGYEW